MKIMRESIKQVFKYGVVGVIGLGIEWAIFFLIRDFFHLNYIFAHVIGSVCAIFNNFILNSYFTFKATDKLITRAISFFSIAGVGLLVGVLLLPALVKLINIFLVDSNIIDLSIKNAQNIAKLITTVIVAGVQFVFNKLYTFRKKNI